MWPKDGSTTLPQSGTAEGQLEEAGRLGVLGLGKGAYPSPSRSRWGRPLWLGFIEAEVHVASTQCDKEDHCILETLAQASIPELLPKPLGSLQFRYRTMWG